MGQRHQIFLIARIRHRNATSSRYRCIAAFHHQWMYGRLPLAACSTFITLLKNEDNNCIAKAELEAIASSYSEDEEFPERPAPFLSSILFMALSIRLERKYNAGLRCCFLDANMRSVDGDNNDGVTIIDVTNPSSPAYCFVSINGLEAGTTVEESVPLTAETYVTAYYPDPSEDALVSMDKEACANYADIQEHINLFKDVQVIQSWMLHEAWPNDGYRDDKPESRQTDLSDSEASVPPLSELCLQKAMKNTKIDQDIAAFEATMSLPGVGAKLLEHLVKVDQISDTMIGPMINALSDCPGRDHSVLDLSLYSLTPKQIIEVASHFSKTCVLNLNKNPYITVATLVQLLSSLPELTRLIIYDCPGISTSDVEALRCDGDFPNLQAVYHRDYMMSAYEDDKIQPGLLAKFTGTARVSFTFAYGQIQMVYCGDAPLMGCTVPFLSPRAVVVSLCDTFNYLTWASNHRDITCCFASLPRAPNVPFAERVVGNIPGRLSLGSEGWIFLIDLPTDWPFWGREAMAYGFVKLSPGLFEGPHDTSSLDLEIVSLAEWLEIFSATDKVETEWVEQLSDYLGKVPLITKDQACELLELP